MAASHRAENKMRSDHHLFSSEMAGGGPMTLTFIQAANIILMRPHNWEKHSFGTWLKEAAKRLHRNKAATALANKLARIAWGVLRNDNTFDITHSEVEAV
jgi:transposase